MLPLLIADIYELAGSLRELGETTAESVGESHSRWQVMSVASTSDKTVPQIARRLGTTRQSVQRQADLLVSDGVAEYAANPDHKRSPILKLTNRGEQQLQKLTDAAARQHIEMANELKADELAVAIKVLRKMRDELRKR